MSSIANNDFQIADLIAINYKDNYLDYLDSKTKKQLEGVTFYPDTVYFLEKITSSDNGVYLEYYTDVLYSLDIFERESFEPFKFDPELFEVRPFPSEYLTSEEMNKGIITRSRIFTIFQEINQEKQKEIKSNVKKLKKI